jgi:hypothetical protein
MMASFELALADLDALRAAVAHSSILLRPVALDMRLADWERTRGAPDVDSVVLAWIASHVPGRRRGAPRRFDA